ncbi:hypothetical protein [Fusobacterium sp.]|jgi:hypothetical protein|uniref:hypothetical protein n=1 Tax=Fusobacterium sp. TaxID=68766 RepID=UPI002A81DD84|nr:hypothetical protein [Fusobacterium sp.]
MYSAKEVAKLCECSISKAYNIIRGLNQKMIKNGIPKESIIAGKISKKFFHETMKI